MVDDASLVEHIVQMCQAILDEDEDALYEAVNAVARAAQQAPPDEVQVALELLSELTGDILLGYGNVARVIGVVTDHAPDPTIALPGLADRAAGALEQLALFAETYPPAFGDLPDRGDLELLPATHGRFVGAAGSLGLTEDDAIRMVIAWFCAGPWVQTMLALCHRKDLRLALPRPQRDRLLAATAAVSELVDEAHWLHGLLQVVDDEPLVVIDSTFAGTGRGWRVTISGIGDNFQLHTLLAAALVGEGSVAKLPGTRPPAIEIAAATDSAQVRLPGALHGVWEMADAHGEQIWHEGRPADIPVVDGARVVVLVGTRMKRTWNPGRLYPDMRPELTVNGELSAAEAAAWLGRIKVPAAG